MSSAQRSRSALPLDQQSVLPTVRGLPWWGAVLLATVVTALGAAVDANNSDSLGSIFKFCYLLGCVAAALAVRRRALFTAAAQPPLIAFLVGVIALYGLNAKEASGLKSLVFKVLLPIANDFPWMALTFVVTLVLVLARWLLTRNAARAEKRPDRTRSETAKNPDARSTDTTGSRAKSANTKSTATRRLDTPARAGTNKRTASSRQSRERQHATEATVAGDSVPAAAQTRGLATPADGRKKRSGAGEHSAGRTAKTVTAQNPESTPARPRPEGERRRGHRRAVESAPADEQIMTRRAPSTRAPRADETDQPAPRRRRPAETPNSDTRSAERHAAPRRTERPAPATTSARETVSARSTAAVPPPRAAEAASDPVRRRATAGQVLRAEHGTNLDAHGDEEPARRTARPRPVRDSEAYESRIGTTSAYPSTRSRNRR